MARDPSLLISSAPTSIVPARVTIGHVQLRDLIICPRERGVVNYVQGQSIIEHNLNSPESPPRTIAELSFTPNTLTSLNVPGTNDTLLAAGGQDAEIHLSYHAPASSRHRRSSHVWQQEVQLQGSINNSVLLTSLSLTRSHESSAEPRIAISNNDCTVKFYNVPLRTRAHAKRGLEEVGKLRLDVAVNHSSISPDGRTLLSVGDSSKVYLHRITGGGRISFAPLATLTLPPPDYSLSISPSSSLAASFSTAFSCDGSKFAVASQEGTTVVWDVRSTKPLKVFHTDKSRAPRSNGFGVGSGWLSDDPGDWTRGRSKAPGWSVRSVKFGGSGKELMMFTEHTSLLHVVDANTFETEEIVRVPVLRGRTPVDPQPLQTRSSTSQQLRPPSPTHRHIFSPSRFSSTSPPRYFIRPRSQRTGHSSRFHIVQTLGDSFRIPTSYSPPSTISDSTWRALRMNGPGSNNGDSAEDTYNDLLVIPRMGDREIETEVQNLLGSHGFRTRRQSEEDEREDAPDHEGEGDEADPNTGSTHADYEYSPDITMNPWQQAAPGAGAGSGSGLGSGLGVGNANGGRGRSRRQGREDDMDLDEPESDCTSSSHTPSRSSSPSPSTFLHSMSSPGLSSTAGRAGSPPSSFGTGSSLGVGLSVGVSRMRSGAQPEITYVDELDLAGTCFDPAGHHVYVASTDSVVEWGVKGAEKRWWADAAWH